MNEFVVLYVIENYHEGAVCPSYACVYKRLVTVSVIAYIYI